MKLNKLGLEERIGYRPDIDGLRAIAVLSVVAFHAFPIYIKGGSTGVDVFFVISGFLISTIILNGLESGTFSFIKFYNKRLRRIFPSLITVLLACLVFGYFSLFADEFKQLAKHVVAGTIFVSNFVLCREAGYFDNISETKPLLHLWSLGIEEQFYIIWPLLLWLGWKKRIILLVIIVIILITSFGYNLVAGFNDKVIAFYSPVTRFWELLVGAVLAYIQLYKLFLFKTSKIKLIVPMLNSIKLHNVVSIFGGILVFIGFFLITKERHLPIFLATMPVLGVVMIIAAGETAWFNRTILSNQILVWIGVISFPIYLWHWPLLSFARIIESQTPHRIIRIIAVLLTILLAWITYKFVENPMRFGKYEKLKTIVLIGVMFMIGIVGFEIYQKEGYKERKSIKLFMNNKNELLRLPAVDESCKNYINSQFPLFSYCRYNKVGDGGTVAIIGDSHAHAAFPGITKRLEQKGINTVLLASSGCLPFFGTEFGFSKKEKANCKKQIVSIIDIIKFKEDISKVFIFTRGPIYMTGKEFGNISSSYDENNPPIPQHKFFDGLQKTINVLKSANKKVFYVTENPELYYSPEICLARPFRLNKKNCDVELSAVTERQRDYLAGFQNMNNVNIINSLSVFCPNSLCKAFDENGVLLYADDDHLSVEGSIFQANTLLKSYL